MTIKEIKCYACENFDTDGIDGNHPWCRFSRAPVFIDEDCPHYNFGIPSGYPVSMERNTEKAYEIKILMAKHVKREE